MRVRGKGWHRVTACDPKARDADTKGRWLHARRSCDPAELAPSYRKHQTAILVPNESPTLAGMRSNGDGSTRTLRAGPCPAARAGSACAPGELRPGANAIQ